MKAGSCPRASKDSCVQALQEGKPRTLEAPGCFLEHFQITTAFPPKQVCNSLTDSLTSVHPDLPLGALKNTACRVSSTSSTLTDKLRGNLGTPLLELRHLPAEPPCPGFAPDPDPQLLPSKTTAAWMAQAFAPTCGHRQGRAEHIAAEGYFQTSP